MNQTEDVENKNALKHMYNQSLLNRVAQSLLRAYKKFDHQNFKKLMPRLKSLEMKPRVRFIRDTIQQMLPAEYPAALKIILQSAQDGTLSGFDLWPYTEFIQTYGIEHPEISLDALKKITPLFTAEWAIRPFIIRDSVNAMKFLEACAKDKNHHVRRWASEGSRPRLPWGERLQDFVCDPRPTYRILEALKFDPEIYVRKSVSNHLNDIAKDHPDIVVKILTRWKKQAGMLHAVKVDWIIRRALRTLIKQGHAGALKLIGVSSKTEIKMKNFKTSRKRIKLGDRFDFDFEIQSLSRRSQKLVVDYVIHFMKANKTRSAKVFKLRTFDLSPMQTVNFSKSHHVKKITTREYYAGAHWLEIQINGVVTGRLQWDLEI